MVVIGVDITPDMVAKTRANAAKGGYANVEFHLGEIEHLPLADATMDGIISNCVTKRWPDKAQVFRDAFRVLQPGGRLAISDIVTTALLPVAMQKEVALYTACVAGAASADERTLMLSMAGFADIRIAPKDASRESIRHWASGRGARISSLRPPSRPSSPQAEGEPQ